MKLVIYGLFAVGIIILVFSTMLISYYPLKYKSEIRSAANLYDVDSALIAAVINAESSYRPNAVSNKGAVGLMQIMPATAEWVADQISIELTETNLKHPETNITIGTYYLKYLLDKFGDTKTALIAYNAGEGKVISWLTQKKYATESDDRAILHTSPYSSTNKYVEKVLNGRKFYKHKF